MSFHTIRMFPVCAALAATLALTAAPAMAQTVGQAACPDGVTQKGVALRVTGVAADRATLQGSSLGVSRRDVEALSDVTGSWPGDWRRITLYFGVRGYGYPDGVQDARKVPFTDGDLVHGAWPHAGSFDFSSLTPTPTTFLSLVPSTKYVAQLVVGELRTWDGRNVTNDFVRGTTTPAMPNKPKPVLAQVCFETAASPS